MFRRIGYYMLLYALHDALLKAMPGSNQATSLAVSYSASEDGLIPTALSSHCFCPRAFGK
jgi:hypothetical protein